MDTDILERLELKLAYLERANQDLSDVVYGQQQEIAALTLRLQTLLTRMEDVAQPQRPWTQEEEKPPHY